MATQPNTMFDMDTLRKLFLTPASSTSALRTQRMGEFVEAWRMVTLQTLAGMELWYHDRDPANYTACLPRGITRAFSSRLLEDAIRVTRGPTSDHTLRKAVVEAHFRRVVHFVKGLARAPARPFHVACLLVKPASKNTEPRSWFSEEMITDATRGWLDGGDAPRVHFGPICDSKTCKMRQANLRWEHIDGESEDLKESLEPLNVKDAWEATTGYFLGAPLHAIVVPVAVLAAAVVTQPQAVETKPLPGGVGQTGGDIMAIVIPAPGQGAPERVPATPPGETKPVPNDRVPPVPPREDKPVAPQPGGEEVVGTGTDQPRDQPRPPGEEVVGTGTDQPRVRPGPGGEEVVGTGTGQPRVRPGPGGEEVIGTGTGQPPPVPRPPADLKNRSVSINNPKFSTVKSRMGSYDVCTVSYGGHSYSISKSGSIFGPFEADMSQANARVDGVLGIAVFMDMNDRNCRR